MRTEVKLADSFQYATAVEREWALAAGMEVPRRLGLILAALRSAKLGDFEKKRFEKWFGKYNEQKWNTVFSNFQKIHASTKGLFLYYRGKSLLNKGATEIVKSSANQSTPEAVRIYPILEDAGFYSPDSARDKDKNWHYIFLGAKMWGPTVKQHGIPGRYTSRCAVLIHELTHIICKTEDITNGYGSNNCLMLAKKKNSMEAIKNASNYQWYSDEFS